MGMNVLHRLCCRSNYWATSRRAQAASVGADATSNLDERTLEIGPGYGANLRVLADKTPSLTCVEIDGPDGGVARPLRLTRPHHHR